jgi:hypothetical protein
MDKTVGALRELFKALEQHLRLLLINPRQTGQQLSFKTGLAIT